jgi:hypothetical protein
VKFRAWALLLLLLPPAGRVAAEAKVRSGLLSTDFDGDVSGARSIGMGETGAAVSGSPESPIWNPAALHDLTSPTFSADFDVARVSPVSGDLLTANSPLRGRKLTYLGFAASDAAFFYRPLANFNQRTVTDAADPDNNFIENDLRVIQFGLSAASEMSKGADVGINLTYLDAQRALATATATAGRPPSVELADGHGFTMDVGLRDRTENAALGVAFFNLPGLIYWNRYRTDQLPIIMKAGAAFYPVPLFGLVGDYEKRFYRGGLPQQGSTHLGVEITVLPWLQLRGGTFGKNLNDSKTVSFTAGLSAFASKGYRLDFAVRKYTFQEEKVYNYFLSILLPLPEGDKIGRGSPSSSPSPAQFQGKDVNEYR